MQAGQLSSKTFIDATASVNSLLVHESIVKPIPLVEAAI